jgi:hypothetical protein
VSSGTVSSGTVSSGTGRIEVTRESRANEFMSES